MMESYELVVFEPKNPDTYPSVCADPGEVSARFGFTGGELLLFDALGNYVGQIVNRIGEEG